MAKPTKKFNPRDWTVHPNRSETGPDEPGRNGHFRVVRLPPPTAAKSAGMCLVRVELPRGMSHLADTDGWVTFGDADTWQWAVSGAWKFARDHTDVEVPRPYGFKYRGKWHWWDGTTTPAGDASRLFGPDAHVHVREFVERLFPGWAITVIDLRSADPIAGPTAS